MVLTSDALLSNQKCKSCRSIYPRGRGGVLRLKEVLGTCRGIGSHFHPLVNEYPFSNLNFGKSMGRIFFKTLFSRNFRKFNTNFAKNSQNRGKFLIFGKCMGTILGQNLVNVWVSFHIPRGTSLPTKSWVPPPRDPVRDTISYRFNLHNFET